jgi:hypothetical protein
MFSHPQIDLQIESGEYFLKKEERELRKTEKKKVRGRQLQENAQKRQHWPMMMNKY